MKKRDCTIRIAKTKALISFAVTANRAGPRDVVAGGGGGGHTKAEVLNRAAKAARG